MFTTRFDRVGMEPSPTVVTSALLAGLPLRLDPPTIFLIGYVLAWLWATVNAFRPKTRFLRAWRACAVVLTAGLSMLLASFFIGSSLDEQGYLHEPFFLIALGSLLSLAGLGLAVLLGLCTVVSRLISSRGN